MMDSMSGICVVVPAYNEAEVISSLLAELVQLPYTVIVVDDGSTDLTAQKASTFPVVVLQHAVNLGQGAALQTGISYALRLEGTKFIVTFDSDGQHDPNDIQRVLTPLQNGSWDVVLGSRFLTGGGSVNISKAKYGFLRMAVTFTRLSTGLKVTDTHNGLRGFTAEAAARIVITQNRMAHASEILSRIAALQLRYCEVPVTITYSAYSLAKGQSMYNSFNIIWDMIAEKMR